MKEPEQRGEESGKRGLLRMRFGLLDWLLFCTLVATWFPYWWAKPQIRALESSNANLMQIGEILKVDDETQIHAMRVKPLESGMNEWKVYVPATANSELRFGIIDSTDARLPDRYHVVSLPGGHHRISVLEQPGSHSRGRDPKFFVYVDHQQRLEKEYPIHWFPDQGKSASYASGAIASIESVMELCRVKHYDSNPSGKSHARGFVVWIAPTKQGNGEKAE